jgi:hypothetical protein
MSENPSTRPRTVWKYLVPVQDDPTNVTMPQDSELVYTASTGNPYAIEVWALVDPSPSARKITRTFLVRGTGQPVPDGTVHRGSVVHTPTTMPGLVAPVVFHLFEVIA